MSQLRFWDVLCATCVCRWWNALWRRWQMCYQDPTPCLSVRSVWWHWRQVTYSQMILYLLYFIGFWLYLHINILVMWIFLGAATDFFFKKLSINLPIILWIMKFYEIFEKYSTISQSLKRYNQTACYDWTIPKPKYIQVIYLNISHKKNSI